MRCGRSAARASMAEAVSKAWVSVSSSNPATKLAKGSWAAPSEAMYSGFKSKRVPGTDRASRA